jgi:hypothetical protein
MITIRNLSGIVEENTLSEFTTKNGVGVTSAELIEFGDFEVAKIVPLYELIELEMREEIITRLPDHYKAKLTASAERELSDLFKTLPLEEDGMSITLPDFGVAVYRFIARNLQGGMLDS